MSGRKTNKKPIVILLILVALAAALLAGMIWFMMTHFFVGGMAYPKDARTLDLRDQIISAKEYESICRELPDCEIRWNIPFQNSAYPDDTTSLAVRSLSEQDLKMLSYFKELKEVDAAGCRDYELLRELKERYPEVTVTYTVSIGGMEYPQDATAVVCNDLTDEEISLMAYLPELRHVDASGCQDHTRIGNLMQAHPELEVTYQAQLLGQTFTEADVSATFKNPDVNALMEGLAWLPAMEKVHLVEPDASADLLRQLMDTYPGITFTWDKTVLGKTFNSAETEYDLSDTPLATVQTSAWANPMSEGETTEVIEKVEEVMAYFPNAEKVILPACYFHNETMAAFREKMRPEYKVVWTVYVTKKKVRTDQEVIHSSAYEVCFIDEQSQDLIYCEDAIVVDIGHSYVKNIEWVKGMPKLKYLILTHNWVKDLTPLSTCKELIYLELYWNDYIPDYSPLLGCTALKDLNVSGTYADIEPLKEMTWLETLFANRCNLTEAESRALEEALPNTKVVSREGMYTGGGWRQVQGYYDMRDIMGLPYNTW